MFVDAADTDPDDPAKEWFMEGILLMARRAKTAAVDCPTTPVGTWEVPVCDDFVHVIDCYPKQYDKVSIKPSIRSKKQSFVYLLFYLS